MGRRSPLADGSTLLGFIFRERVLKPRSSCQSQGLEPNVRAINVRQKIVFRLKLAEAASQKQHTVGMFGAAPKKCHRGSFVCFP